jgi:tetratricopeptide (TPR) repeat protein
MELSSAQRVFLEHMYGDRSVEEVLDSGEFDERTVYGLFAAGLFAFDDEEVMMLLDPTTPVQSEPPPERTPRAPVRAEAPPESPPEIPPEPAEVLPPATERLAELPPDPPDALPPPSEPLAPSPPMRSAFFEPSALERAASPSAAEPSPPAETAPAPAFEPASPPPDEEPVLAALSEFCERMREQDDFDVLGISEKATDAEVRSAYEGLLETIPQDPALWDLPQFKELAEEARNRIDNAFDRLGVLSVRKVYGALRSQSAKAHKKRRAPKSRMSRENARAAQREQLADRGLDAEAWFRKGESSFRAKNFEEAVEAFGMAAHLDPKEGEYLARLGYALFLHRPKDAVVLREALEHLANSIKLSPNREKPYVYLGKIFRQNGATDRARKMFDCAVKIKPDCHEALQELRLLSLREEKNAGLLSKLGKILK